MKKTIGIILWLPITVICLIGKLLIWIGAHAGGVALPVLGVMLILAVFTKNLYAIGIIGVLTIIMIATLFGLAILMGTLENLRDEIVK